MEVHSICDDDSEKDASLKEERDIGGGREERYE